MSSCELALVSAEVIITDTHVKVKAVGAAQLEVGPLLRTAEAENEGEDEEDEAESEESSSSNEGMAPFLKKIAGIRGRKRGT